MVNCVVFCNNLANLNAVSSNRSDSRHQDASGDNVSQAKIIVIPNQQYYVHAYIIFKLISY